MWLVKFLVEANTWFWWILLLLALLRLQLRPKDLCYVQSNKRSTQEDRRPILCCATCKAISVAKDAREGSLPLSNKLVTHPVPRVRKGKLLPSLATREFWCEATLATRELYHPVGIAWYFSRYGSAVLGTHKISIAIAVLRTSSALFSHKQLVASAKQGRNKRRAEATLTV